MRVFQNILVDIDATAAQALAEGDLILQIERVAFHLLMGIAARARAVRSLRALDLHDPRTQQPKQARAERARPEG